MDFDCPEPVVDPPPGIRAAAAVLALDGCAEMMRQKADTVHAVGMTTPADKALIGPRIAPSCRCSAGIGDMSVRNCLLISTYNADRRHWNGVCYEFLDVISGIENSATVAGGSRFTLHDRHSSRTMVELARELALKLHSGVRKIVSGQYAPRMHATTLDDEYDVAFFVCQLIQEIQEINQIKGWRRRSAFAAIFILESWSSSFDEHYKALRLLDEFDHVFVMNGSCIDNLKRYTSTPISQLSTGSNSLLSTPFPDRPARTIDITCLGHRISEVHEKLLKIAQREKLFYYHDVWKNLLADDWGAVRSFNANLIKRSRFYLVWDPISANPRLRKKAAGESALSTRYFEGAAGGAVLLGTVPDCPEFHAQFDWPDAVIPIPEDPADIIRELDSDPERTECIRRKNITNALRRHDWVYRWQQVLEVAGRAPTHLHDQRLQSLGLIASQVESQEHTKNCH